MIYHVGRALRAANGSVLLASIGFATEERAVQEMQQHEQEFMQQIAQCMVVANTPQGARPVMPVANLFVRLGIESFATIVENGEAQSALIHQVKAPPLTLVGPNGKSMS